jgi:hypothetical protein
MYLQSRRMVINTHNVNAEWDDGPGRTDDEAPTKTPAVV